MAISDERLLDVNKVSETLSMGRSFVYSQLLQTGRLRSVKVGNARRVLKSDLDEFIQGLKETSEE